MTRLRNFNVEVLDENEEVVASVHESDYVNVVSTYDLGGVIGRSVQVIFDADMPLPWSLRYLHHRPRNEGCLRWRL